MLLNHTIRGSDHRNKNDHDQDQDIATWPGMISHNNRIVSLAGTVFLKTHNIHIDIQFRQKELCYHVAISSTSNSYCVTSLVFKKVLMSLLSQLSYCFCCRVANNILQKWRQIQILQNYSNKIKVTFYTIIYLNSLKFTMDKVSK